MHALGWTCVPGHQCALLFAAMLDFCAEALAAHLDNRQGRCVSLHAIDEQVVDGMDVIQTIEANPTSRGDAPIKEVVIADCGQIE